MNIFVLIIFVMTAQGPVMKDVPYQTLIECQQAKVVLIEQYGELNNAVGCFEAKVPGRDS